MKNGKKKSKSSAEFPQTKELGPGAWVVTVRTFSKNENSMKLHSYTVFRKSKDGGVRVGDFLPNEESMKFNLAKKTQTL